MAASGHGREVTGDGGRGDGDPIFCGPLSAHWNGRSKSAGKRPRASEGVFAERCVVKERVTVSEHMCHMR